MHKITRPELSDHERERRMKRIKTAAVRVLTERKETNEKKNQESTA